MYERKIKPKNTKQKNQKAKIKIVAEGPKNAGWTKKTNNHSLDYFIAISNSKLHI